MINFVNYTMGKYKKLSHSINYCVYHIVWLPKYRYKILEVSVKDYLDKEIRKLSEFKNVEELELNIQKDHFHIIVSIPPKISISEYVGFVKGKTAIKIFQKESELRKKPNCGNHFWARVYFVSTVGLDVELITRYVKYQDDEEKKMEESKKEFTLF
jgi:putative transposase